MFSLDKVSSTGIQRKKANSDSMRSRKQIQGRIPSAT